MSSHLNDFNTIFSQLSAQDVEFQDSVKALFLLITLPESWDIFCTAISNSAPAGGHTSANVESSLLTEEVNRKNLDNTRGSTALVVRGRSNDKKKGENRGKSRSKSRGRSVKDVECYHCGKKGHYKRDCRTYKQEKGKGKAKEDTKSTVKIEEINAVSEDEGDILLNSDLESAQMVTTDDIVLHDWILDSGASFHVTPHREWFTNYDAKRTGRVRLGNDYACEIMGVGDVQLKFKQGSTFTLKNVRHVPKLTKSLISSGQLDDGGYTTTFGDNSWKITKGSLVVARGTKSGTLYMLHVSTVKDHVICVTEQPSVSLWHRRLGHMSQTAMKELSRSGYLPGFNFSDFTVCEHCLYGKQTQTPHKKGSSRKAEPLQLVHSDVCGPMPMASMGGALYFVTFIDDFSRKVWVYSLRRKDEVLKVFQRYVTLVETQTGKRLKCLRSDNGGEYVSKAFQDFCDAKGIKRELSAPYNPQHNCVAERMNRTIQEKVRCMLSNAGLPNGFWAEALATAVHLINRSPNKKLDLKVAEEIWSGKPPSYKHLRVFGCEAYCHIPKEFRDKLAPKSKKCIFLGYGESGEMGFRLWDPEARKIIRSNDVFFNEEKMHKKPVQTVEIRRVIFQEDGPVHHEQVAQGAGQQNAPIVEAGEAEQQVVAQPVIRRSGRVTRAPDRYIPSLDYVMLTDCDEPSCFKEAMLREDKDKWEKAMQSEMDSLHKNSTWELVHLPAGKRILPCKWIYKLKVTDSASKPRYKARLVAKGFRQQEGIDFEEIFSPVVKMTTLRCVLALVAQQDMELVQMDVKTAFLHGDLREDIYMQQPEGFEEKSKENMVCKLKKSLYGLKQAPREWYHKFHSFMLSQGYKRSDTDHCLYTKQAKDGSLLILILYVDDMLIAGKNIHEVNALKSKLNATFDMKDLGEASHILGMRIVRKRDKKVLFLSQSDYIDKVLKRFNMEKGKMLSTPFPSYVKLSLNDCPKSDAEKAEMAKVPYSSAVGSLMYAMICTRPDIAYAVGVVSRYMSNPGKKHWDAVKSIMRYLNGTREVCICFGSKGTCVEGYTDADYAGDMDKRRSTSGYVFMFTGGAVSWRSRLQNCTSMSTTEAEYIAASEACKEAIWLARLVRDLGITVEIPMLHCDSQSAIMLAKNPVFHAKTKHIDVKYHFIRDMLEDKLLELVKVHTDDNPADLMTKGLPPEKFAHCRALMGVG